MSTSVPWSPVHDRASTPSHGRGRATGREGVVSGESPQALVHAVNLVRARSPRIEWIENDTDGPPRPVPPSAARRTADRGRRPARGRTCRTRGHRLERGRLTVEVPLELVLPIAHPTSVPADALRPVDLEQEAVFGIEVHRRRRSGRRDEDVSRSPADPAFPVPDVRVDFAVTGRDQRPVLRIALDLPQRHARCRSARRRTVSDGDPVPASL